SSKLRREEGIHQRHAVASGRAHGLHAVAFHDIRDEWRRGEVLTRGGVRHVDLMAEEHAAADSDIGVEHAAKARGPSYLEGVDGRVHVSPVDGLAYEERGKRRGSAGATGLRRWCEQADNSHQCEHAREDSAAHGQSSLSLPLRHTPYPETELAVDIVE